MKNSIYILLAVIILFNSCRKKHPVTPKTTEYITISGHYYDAHCKPVQGVVLVLSGYCSSTGFINYEYVGAGDTTKNDGAFKFKIPKGSYGSFGTPGGLSLSRPFIGGVLVTDIPAIDGTNFNFIADERVRVTIKLKDLNHRIQIGDTLCYTFARINAGAPQRKKVINNLSSEFILFTDSVSMDIITQGTYIGANQIDNYSRDVKLIWGIGINKYMQCSGYYGNEPSADCNIVTTNFEECAGQKEIIITVP